MFLIRLSILCFTSVATLLGGGLRGRVICFADDHVAVERPHAPRACEHHHEDAASEEPEHGPCHDLSAQEPEAGPAAVASPDLGDMPRLPGLLTSLPDCARDLCSGSAVPAPPPRCGADPWGAAGLRSVVLLI